MEKISLETSMEIVQNNTEAMLIINSNDEAEGYIKWKPGINTLGYYKFDNNLIDTSGNNANASNINSNTFVQAYSGSSKYVLNKISGNCISIPATMLNSQPQTWTILFFFKSTQTQGCWLMGPNNGGDRFGGLIGAEIDSLPGISIQYGGQRNYQRMARNSSAYRDGTRKLISFRRGTGDVIAGVNNNFTTLYSGSSSPQNYILGPKEYFIGARRSGTSMESEFQMGDFIVENKYRSDDEIISFLNKMKSEYGIS